MAVPDQRAAVDRVEPVTWRAAELPVAAVDRVEPAAWRTAAVDRVEPETLRAAAFPIAADLTVAAVVASTAAALVAAFTAAVGRLPRRRRRAQVSTIPRSVECEQGHYPARVEYPFPG